MPVYLEDIVKERGEDLSSENVSRPQYSTIGSCVNTSTYNHDLLSGRHVDNILSDLFFSDKNRKIIQNAIRKRVFDEIGEIISEQNETQVSLIMRYYYFNYARHMQTCVTSQIKELNERVVTYILPAILTEIKQYFLYIQDHYTVVKPVYYPEQTTSHGSVQFDLFQEI
jgi:hypothetical protein